MFTRQRCFHSFSFLLLMNQIYLYLPSILPFSDIFSFLSVFTISKAIFGGFLTFCKNHKFQDGGSKVAHV